MQETTRSNLCEWKFPVVGRLFMKYLCIFCKQSPSSPENPICSSYYWNILISTSEHSRKPSLMKYIPRLIAELWTLCLLINPQCTCIVSKNNLKQFVSRCHLNIISRLKICKIYILPSPHLPPFTLQPAHTLLPPLKTRYTKWKTEVDKNIFIMPF